MTRKLFIPLILIALIGGAILWFRGGGAPEVTGTATTTPSTPPSEEKAATSRADKNSAPQSLNNKKYANLVYHFSFTYPKDFTLRELHTEGVDTIVLEKSGSGLQIMISPFDEATPLTRERILQDVPDFLITNVTSITVGNRGQGIAFASDNPAFGGKSQEAWFIYNKYLYQISTYAGEAPLLESVLTAWRFE